jgi:putative tryptophan/tyrosine transport system substrate-binding protein
MLGTDSGVRKNCLREVRNQRSEVCKSILCLTVDVMFFALRVSTEAQQPTKIPRVGILFIGGRDQPHLEAFKQGLRERGYTEGKNIVLDYRYAEGKVDRLPSLAAELVQLKLDVIVTTSGNSAEAASEATKTIPIVLTTGADPVKSGLLKAWRNPGATLRDSVLSRKI